MNVSLQQTIDRVAGRIICRLLSLAPVNSSAVPAPGSPRRILVILLSEMGSLVLTHPMFAYLNKTYPGASLYALVFEQNRDAIEMLDVVHPENILSVSNRSFGRLAGDSIRIIKQLRRIGIDTVIDCELFSRVSSIFSRLSGAAVRAGFHPYTQEGLYRGNFINRPVLYNPHRHISEQFVTLAAAVDSVTVPCGKRLTGTAREAAPPVTIGPGELAACRARLLGDFPPLAGKELVLLYPSGGLLPIRAWPREHYCTVAAALLQAGYGVGIIGLADDKPLAEHIGAQCRSPYCVDMTGYTETIRDLVVMFHHARLLITNDGGPGHFAAVASLPAIILFGPETPSLYGSLSTRAVNFYTPLSCSPCLTACNHRRSPCDGNNLCLQQITPEDVLAKAFEILAGDRSECNE